MFERAKMTGSEDFLNNNSNVQEVVQTLHAELIQLIRQRANLVKRMGTIKQTLSGLANLYGNNTFQKASLS